MVVSGGGALAHSGFYRPDGPWSFVTLIVFLVWTLVTSGWLAWRAAGEHGVITCSALRGRNVPSLLPKALELADRATMRIPTPELNRGVSDVVAKTPPPTRRGRQLRLYYAAQVGEQPPGIAIQVNDRRLITRDWAYHLENRLRETYGFEGVPLVIDFVPHSGRRR